jgi:hypothetical protein
MAPAADLRFALDSVSAAGLRSSVPRPPILTPGSESHTDDLELNPMNEFTRRRLRLRLKGSVHRTVAECATFASHLKIECIDKEKQ